MRRRRRSREAEGEETSLAHPVSHHEDVASGATEESGAHDPNPAEGSEDGTEQH